MVGTSRSLAAAVRPFVNHAARARGEVYFRTNRVFPEHSDGAGYSAVVRGGRPYQVALRMRDERLIVECTCPYFSDRVEPCKHIWAAVLAADQDGRIVVPPDLWVDLGDAEDLSPTLTTTRPRVPPEAPVEPPVWRSFLAQVAAGQDARRGMHPLIGGVIVYVIDATRTGRGSGLAVELLARERKKSGEWGKPKPVRVERRDLSLLPDPGDRAILEDVCGAEDAAFASPGFSDPRQVPGLFTLSPQLQRNLVPRLCATGRLLLRVPPSSTSTRAEPSYVEIDWDDEPADFRLQVTGDKKAGYTIGGTLRRDGVPVATSNALVIAGAVILWKPRRETGRPTFAPFETHDADRWMQRLLSSGPVMVPPSEAGALTEALVTSNLTNFDAPAEIRGEIQPGVPRPCLRVTRPQGSYSRGYHASGDRLDATLSFLYGDTEIDAWRTQPAVFDAARGIGWRRDFEAERMAAARLHAVGVRRSVDWGTGGTRMDLADSELATIVRALLTEGWRVEADGKLYRQPGATRLDVSSGIDWFELHGGVDFDGLRADLPALLAAAKRGDRFVELGDGTFGVIPEAWLARAGRLTAIGTTTGDHVRFETSQAALLDAWLAAEPQVSFDETFGRLREQLAQFDGIAQEEAPPTFTGSLRHYQREALGWFSFLRRFHFGGCLADEMGLGKTVMVLAALEARRLERERDAREHRPSLIVVPRSLVFNWLQESARFAPSLRVFDFTGAARRDLLPTLASYDVVLTTYGTLRRDIGELKAIPFDYAILDEAQAIKNARTAAAKSARLIKAEHRLALSGTPVENHLGELWSLFEFLNPGMLGAASVFSGGQLTRGVDPETLAILAQGVRPFILRRTKEQVASELPARTEQTLYCDLEPEQRSLYDELRDHYRAALLGKGADGELNSAKLQILEALLRLRQAACHPGLIDPARADDPAAKLDLLVPRLEELAEDGRKALIFSQFTSLLALLRARLDKARIRYEYLDGKTRDRQAKVERFQTDRTPLFLVSLKAGGVGLNLTAAEYVFLLDPWWNPAVEAQAIDRAHRIGQTKPVFAFRLIARDTVEEKVLQLQASKRQLAEAIVRADESLVRSLKREDLELLLS